ncbi:hypothetical protein G3I01_14525 [Gramella sp. MT6]|uniref:hypothetical protein n=1 Tax=Gramella sp. MT6 TaxID=2705471 RepID=UPI001C5EBF26|nr:hypothetical protein [Gramella sp. MT6]QYA23959.1 hypothetical protein G3I01_14525 [Gramella sp. MT6]
MTSLELNEIMEWTFVEFKTSLDDLHPEVKGKAIKIAKKLVIEIDYTRQNAIKEGIMKADEWFYDLEG